MQIKRGTRIDFGKWGSDRVGPDEMDSTSTVVLHYMNMNVNRRQLVPTSSGR